MKNAPLTTVLIAMVMMSNDANAGATIQTLQQQLIDIKAEYEQQRQQTKQRIQTLQRQLENLREDSLDIGGVSQEPATPLSRSLPLTPAVMAPTVEVYGDARLRYESTTGQ